MPSSSRRAPAAVHVDDSQPNEFTLPFADYDLEDGIALWSLWEMPSSSVGKFVRGGPGRPRSTPTAMRSIRLPVETWQRLKPQRIPRKLVCRFDESAKLALAYGGPMRLSLWCSARALVDDGWCRRRPGSQTSLARASRNSTLPGNRSERAAYRSKTRWNGLLFGCSAGRLIRELEHGRH